MSNVWFTSDLHIGHETVAVQRFQPAQIDGPAAITWHDAALARGWDERVRPEDQVWILGDISAGGKAAQANALTWLVQRPGVKHLVTGNHDGCHPMYRDAAKYQAWYLSCGIASVQPFARRRINGQSVLLSHYPYTGDHTSVDRHTQWRLRDGGLPILHGHTHSRERLSYADHIQTFHGPLHGTPQAHVGVDAWGLSPVDVEQIAELIAGAS